MMNYRAKKWILSVSLGILILTIIAGLFVNWFMSDLSYDPKVDYLTVLKESPGYDDTEISDVVFSYESKDSPELRKLRETYALDSIAGSGTDLEKSQNLLKWVHELIKHDGSRPLPSKRDAITLIESAKKSGEGLNCRGLAVILSETLLSVGVKSRFVELLPKDFSSDSHVVTLAYLSEFDRWIFLDPSYQAYFVDESGHYLGVFEIRLGLLNEGVLKVNQEINYNGGPVDVDYLHYLSKNFYRFASPEYSGFGIDSSAKRKMIILNPVGNNDGRRNPFSRDQIVHNPDIFWRKP